MLWYRMMITTNSLLSIRQFCMTNFNMLKTSYHAQTHFKCRLNNSNFKYNIYMCRIRPNIMLLLIKSFYIEWCFVFPLYAIEICGMIRNNKIILCRFTPRIIITHKVINCLFLYYCTMISESYTFVVCFRCCWLNKCQENTIMLPQQIQYRTILKSSKELSTKELKKEFALEWAQKNTKYLLQYYPDF